MNVGILLCNTQTPPPPIPSFPSPTSSNNYNKKRWVIITLTLIPVMMIYSSLGSIRKNLFGETDEKLSI